MPLDSLFKIYESFGAIAVKLPYGSPALYDAESLEAERDGDYIHLKDSYTGAYIFYNVLFSRIRNKAGNGYAGTSAGLKVVLDSLLDDDDPSSIVKTATFDQVLSPISALLKTDVAAEKSVQFSATGGKLDVQENKVQMKQGLSEVKIEGGTTTLSVKSNTANTQGQSAEAIKIIGKSDSQDSTVDVKGQLKVSQAPLSVWKFTASSGVAQEVNNISVNGNDSELELPDSTLDGSISNGLIQGSVSIGDQDNTRGTGQRNYICIGGLSTGATVKVDASIKTHLTQPCVLRVDCDRVLQSAFEVSVSSTGVVTSFITKTFNVTNFSDLKVYYDIDTTGTGTINFLDIEVTIS